jgi:hypothetical protein
LVIFFILFRHSLSIKVDNRLTCNASFNICLGLRLKGGKLITFSFPKPVMSVWFPRMKADFYRRALPFIFRDHPPVFTHGDLQQKNILVRKVPCSGKGEETRFKYEIAILDWEFAGWYPSYWEYSRALFACG